MATHGKSEIEAYLGSAAKLIKRLKTCDINAVAMTELDATLKIKSPRSPAAKAAEFDSFGTQIWNAAIRLKDQSDPILKTWPQLEPQLRVLACFLLNTAQQSYVKHGTKKSSQNLVRILKTALKAARICIDSGALDLCTMLFEKVAEHVEHKQDPPPEHKRDKQESEAQEMIKELTADYYLLRATTSWKQNKLDNVNFWFTKVVLLPNRSDMLHLAEKKADLAYEVGKSAIQKKQFASAVRWLDQSFQIFQNFDQELLSSDFCDLRLVVMLDYARALVGVGDALSLDKASSLLVTLDQEHGFKTEVHVLRLDIIYAQKPFEADQFCGDCSRSYAFGRHIQIYRELTVLRIMYQIQKLNIYNPNKDSATNQTTVANSTPGPHSCLACQTLDLLLSRLLGQPSITQAWIEKIVVTRVWISSLSTQVQDHPSKLGNLFDDIAHTNGTRLGPEATHASQSLIWKAVTALQQAAKEDEAARWCGLANHEIFASSGELNKAKLLRKSMTVALSRDDATAARAAYHQMSENGKSAAMTQYLMYKIALRENDVELGVYSLLTSYTHS
ncbi:hypothetical protein E4T44_06486 [Aureobasidium sp. EXF-8845]|nr:hypothetical protein E4T44_06486 [Aureobasidium sp. EXF-8845]